MTQRHSAQVACGLLILCCASAFPDDGPPPPGESAPASATQSYQRWLDDVRAQREAQRQVRRQALEVREHLLDPVGAAHRDALERQVEQDIEAARKRRELQQQAIRRRRRLIHSPWERTKNFEDRSKRDLEVQPTPSIQGVDLPPTAPPLPPSPYGWDNRWYYRGY